jgi:acetyl esterase/lipase
MTQTRRRLFTAALAASGGLAAACSPLRAFNTLAPKDGDVRLVARGLAFGPGPRQAMDVYAPTDTTAGIRPMLVFFYGGSWNSGRRQDYAWVGRALAAQGFVVAVPDYRLVPEVRFPAFVEDGAAAVARLRTEAPRLGGDPDRIVLAGHSAGAYTAVLLGLDRRWLEGPGVPEGAVRGAAGLAGPYDFYPWDAASAIAAFGQAPDPRQTQPITFARGDAPSLWLGTGDADETVRPRNSLRLGEAVRAAGGRAEVKLYPGVDHIGIVLALSRPFRGRAPVLADLTAFARGVTA